jgi:hypothetical protein
VTESFEFITKKGFQILSFFREFSDWFLSNNGYTFSPGGGTMPSFSRFLFRVKDRYIEEEARNMVASLGINDIEIRRDDTIKDAWLEDNKLLKTIYGLEDIKEYLENLIS